MTRSRCSVCGKNRTLDTDGVCHQCWMAAAEKVVCVECKLLRGQCECPGGPYAYGSGMRYHAI